MGFAEGAAFFILAVIAFLLGYLYGSEDKF